MPESLLVVRCPREFLCEHTPSKSRVHAVVMDQGSATLQAVLTCTDRNIAEQAADVLNAALVGGAGPAVQAAADAVVAALPTAPSASLREALTHAYAATWAESGADDVSDETDAVSPWDDQESRTPSDARLTELAGPVVRIIRLTEHHIHDQQRLLASARAHGFEPIPEKDRDDNDPQDLVGALAHLAECSDMTPGADMVTDKSTTQLLRATGFSPDELADWSGRPISADFGPGWRLSRHTAVGAQLQTQWGPMPDFAKLFPIADGDPDDDEWQITPRTADILYSALTRLADEAYNDIARHGNAPVSPEEADGDWTVFNRLPRITRSYSARWRRDFARAADDLLHDLEDGTWPDPRSTAEELVLHLAIEDAPSVLEMIEDVDDDVHDAHASLPKHPDDYDWDVCDDILFQDADVLMLYTESMETVYVIGPEDWFTPFQNLEPRDPGRGYRR